MKPIVAPSVLAADFANLEREIKMINESQADWIHVDIMDGVFVPNLSMGIPVVKAIKKHATKLLDVHLMIIDPDRYVQVFRDAGAEIISVHIEASNHLHRSIDLVKSLGCKAGVAVNPHTSVQLLENVIRDIDLVCLMSVNPGYGGQQFIEHTYAKIRQLRAMIQQTGSNALIEIDGGVNQDNAPKLVDAGVDVLVAGNFVFNSNNPKDVIQRLKSLG